MGIDPSQTTPAGGAAPATGPAAAPPPGMPPPTDNKKYTNMASLADEHPEVMKVINESIAMKMVNDLKHEEDDRKRRLKEMMRH